MTDISVLDHGFVRLDGALADDLSVVNSARVSFADRSKYLSRTVGITSRKEAETKEEGVQMMRTEGVEAERYLSDRDAGLIRFLMKNRHGTPFEHNIFRFHVKAPIFVFREWQRHRISSYNEWSARYSQLEPEFYVPEIARTQIGKPGAYTFQDAEPAVTASFRYTLEKSNANAYDEYETAIRMGIAKEQARLFLPVNIYSQMYWTVNARSLMNFLSLRNSDHAMFEIREYAKVIEQIFQEKMPVTAQAFIENDRTAP